MLRPDAFLGHLPAEPHARLLTEPGASFYDVPRADVARILRAILGFPSIHVVDSRLLERAIEVCDADRLDFAEAYLVGTAESSRIEAIASFDRSIDRVGSIRREEPA